MNRLQNIADYRSRFAAAFGDNNITTDRILKAIATFERGIVANDSRFDQYMRGNTNAMNNQEIAEYNLKMARGALQPSLRGSYSFGTNYFYSQLFDTPEFTDQISDNKSHNFSINLSIPIFNEVP